MGHHLLLKPPFARRGSAPAVPIISSPGKSSNITLAPSSQELFSLPSPVPSTPLTINLRYSNTPMPLVVLPRPERLPASTRSRRPVNLFKKLLGKQASFPSLNVSKGDKTWKDFRLRFHTDAVAGDKNDSSELDTPTSLHRLQWDYAKTVYSRGSVDVRTSIFSNKGPAFYDILSPTNKVPPIDHSSTHRSTADPESRPFPPPKEPLNHEIEPIGCLVFAQSPSECSVHSISSAGDSEYSTSQTIYLTEEEEPSCPVLQFVSPPKPVRHMRRTSLMLRPVSSGGPAPQVLSPPPVKVRFPARRGVPLQAPRRLPPTPSPRRRSRRSIRQPQLLYGSTQNVSEPGSPTSLTPEEGLVQLQVRTQRADKNTPQGYRRSFKHVRGLNSRVLLPPPHTPVRPFRPLPPLPTTAPLNACLDTLGGADIGSEFESLTELISSASSDTSGLLSTPHSTGLDIVTAWSQKEFNPASDYPWSCAPTRQDKYASTFLNLDPSVLSPISPEPLNTIR